METASTCNERTPLLGDFSIDIPNNDQTSVDGNNTLKQKAPLDGNCTTSNEQTPHIGQDSIKSSGETNEVSLEEIVQAMCSAWRQYRQPKDCAKDYRRSKETSHYSVFTVKELYAMRLAWQNLIRDKKCSIPPHIAAEAVATAITKELLPVPECDGNDLDADFQMQFATKKNIIATDILEAWFSFLDDDINDVLYLFPIRYIETMFQDHIEEPPVGFTFWPRVVELYDKVHDFFMEPKLQLILHNLLFIWPISFLILGTKYLDCPMGHHLSILMLLVGCLGGFATLFRLALMYLYQGHSLLDYFWKWKCLTWIELTFLVVFFIQAFHFFYIDPTTEPDPKQCVQDFYNAALVINYVTIPLACVYVFAYSIITCSNVFNCWIWTVRRF